jgi:TPR repeat protein
MSEASQKRARDAIDLTTEDVSPREKKMRESINGVAAELRCPITQELPFDPVIAEDGKIYERKAILEWFSKKDRPISPSTGAVIGKKLLPAVQTKNTIEMLVKSGAIVGEIAEAWKEKLADEKEVKEMRTKAEGGDGLAMWTLGVWYQNGMKGLAKDLAQARAWYGRSAAVRYPRGTASFGHFLLDGLGGPQDDVFGVMNVTAAAELGSDVGAYFLGYAFFRGAYGLPKDHVRARYWLKKVADSECEHKHLHPDNITEAVEWLRELQDE